MTEASAQFAHDFLGIAWFIADDYDGAYFSSNH